MTDPVLTPSFPVLLQRFFVEHLTHHRAVSPRTIAAYRDTFRLLLGFAEATIGKAPTAIAMTDLDAKLILAFLDHLEKDRKNAVRSRNARLVALRSFLKYAAHHDLTALAVIEQALSIPMKRFERPMLGFLTREEMRGDTRGARCHHLGRPSRPGVVQRHVQHGRPSVGSDRSAQSGHCHRRWVSGCSSPGKGTQTPKRTALEAHQHPASGLGKAIE